MKNEREEIEDSLLQEIELYEKGISLARYTEDEIELLKRIMKNKEQKDMFLSILMLAEKNIEIENPINDQPF